MERMIADKRSRKISDGSLDGAVITRGNTIDRPPADLDPIGEHEHENEETPTHTRPRTPSVLQYYGSAVQIAAGSQQDLQKRVKAEVRVLPVCLQ